MPAVQITIVGLDKASAAVRSAVFSGARQGLEAAAKRGEFLVQENMLHPASGRPVVATGVLLGSIASEVREGPGTIGHAVVFAQPPGGDYAGFVEAGTRPHFPPPSALLLWVKKRFGVANEKQALSIAFAVARGIAKRGTQARRMFENAFTALEGQLGGIFEAAISRAIEAAGLGKT
jgi:hypothetical protein